MEEKRSGTFGILDEEKSIRTLRGWIKPENFSSDWTGWVAAPTGPPNGETREAASPPWTIGLPGEGHCFPGEVRIRLIESEEPERIDDADTASDLRSKLLDE